MLKPIGTPPLHREIQRRIKAYILENELQVGDRLPTEMELTAQLKVSRNALREALKALEAIGLLEVHMGQGTFVAGFDPVKYMDSFTHNLLVEGMGPDEMWEIRQALELAFIGRVVECISEEDLQILDGFITEMESDIANDSFTTLTSLRMHPILYRCLENRFLDSFLNSYVEFFERLWQPIFEPDTVEGMRLTVQLHRALIESLRRNDPDGARAVLERDFGDAAITAQLASRMVGKNG